MAPTLLVLAAGLGTRYGGFKQVDRVGPGGEVLLEYAVFDARRAGFHRIVFVIRRDLAPAFDALAHLLPPGLDVSCVYQDGERLPDGFAAPSRVKPWGTVHAVLSAHDASGGPYAIVNADDFYGATAYRLAFEACDEAREGTSTVIGLPLTRTLSDHGPVVRGICRVERGFLTQLDEVYAIQRIADGAQGTDAGGPRRLNGSELASMNFWVFPSSVFPQLKDRFVAFLSRRGGDASAELPLPEAVGELIQAGTIRVRAIEAPGPWFGLTHADDRPLAMAGLRELHARGEYPDPLWPR